MTPRQLRAALKRLKLSQSEAARRLGIQQSTIYRWLANERKIPRPVEAAVKCWLGVRGAGVVPSAPSRALNPEIAQRVHAIHESGEAKRREGALLPPGINWETWDFLLDLAVEHVGGVDSGGVAPAGKPSAEQNDATRPAYPGNAVGEALPKP